MNLKLSLLRLTVCLIYQPLNSSDQHDSLIKSYVTSLDSTKDIVLLGNFNLPDIDWDIYSGSSALADDFAEFAYNHDLVQHVVWSHTHCWEYFGHSLI